MKIKYDSKLSEEAYLAKESTPINNIGNYIETSVLVHGDNADVLRSLIQYHDMAGKIDLVYIDPPFSTNTIFRIGDERTSTISPQTTDRIAYKDTLQGEEFIEFIRHRLILIRELMSANGSIYLHIDYKIGHYIKIIMDEVFGIENFRNDITRIKCNPKNFSRKGYGNIKDLILFYTKSDSYIWHEPRIPINDVDIKKLYPKIDENQRRYTTVPIHAPGETANGATSQPWRGVYPPKGRHWRCAPDELEKLDQLGLIEWSKTGNPRKINYADDAITKGKKLQDIWEYKDKPNPEYPTQKNIDLLETIISASSNANSYVLDCFCGSGTTLIAAERLGRRWIGIDKSEPAIEVVKRRLEGIELVKKGYIKTSHLQI
jgi:adenine-specific DNA-methyltransferase